MANEFFRIKTENREIVSHCAHEKDAISKTNRLECLDVARAIAIICVVLNHSVQLVYTMGADEWAILGTLERVVQTVLFSVGRIGGVPLFLCITGVLLINKDFESKATIKRFYWHNIGGLLIVTELWIIIYFFFYRGYLGWCADTTLSPLALFKQMLFLQSSDNSWFWYMPMILGMYVWMPLFAIAIKNLDRNRLLHICLAVPVFLLFLQFSLLDQINIFLQYNGAGNLNLNVLRFPVQYEYIIYIIMGFVIVKVAERESKGIIWGALFFVGLGIAFADQFLIQENALPVGLIGYNNLGVMLAGTGLFGLICKIFRSRELPRRLSVFIQEISRSAMGIYAIHGIILPYLHGNFGWRSPIESRIAKVIILWLVGFSICAILINILKRFSLGKKLIFYK